MGGSTMGFPLNDTITWMGKVDWERRRFRGEEYRIRCGSSHNAYLIRDEKTALIDTVRAPFAREFVAKLKQEIDLQRIDYIIANQGDYEQSGALPALMQEIPHTPIYCTANAAKSLRGQYHQDWNFRIVKDGSKLSLGNKEITFIDMTMLPWPDSIACHLSVDDILFSNNFFSQHLASDRLFNDCADGAALLQEALRYYTLVFTPSNRLVEYKIKELRNLKLSMKMICPSHGVIWRDNPLQIVDAYAKWACAYHENQVSILYDTMGNSTWRMAEAIAQGIRLADPQVVIKFFHTAKTDKADLITEIFKSKAILVGSPTVNRGIMSSVAGLLECINGMTFKGKRAAAFGTFGWSGESARIINRRLQEGGFTVIDFKREAWNPDDLALASCVQFGREFVAKI